MSDKIKVAIRVRPLIEREKLDNLPVRWITKENKIYQIDPVTDKNKGEIYTFDHIFGATESNANVFDATIKPIIDASMQGFNGTVFAYGQTSSGKTYTMSGTQKCLGIIPLAINYIFYSIDNTPGREFLLRVSYMEIYNEKVNDLLDVNKKNLKIHEDSSGQVIVTDVEERVCKNSKEILESRCTDDEDGAVKVSHLNLVDLAGSEKSGQSGATGDRFKEGCHINKSLTTLGLVINQLSDDTQENQFISFRDSKLTRLLQSSLGGNAMTVMVCAVTPAAEDQTQNTLSFASRAKNINNKPILNEVLSESALIKRYLKQIARLNQELEVVKQKSGMVEVEAMSNKLKEKEEMNKMLNERISRLKEALIVSSSSPVRKKAKRVPRDKRRHSWCGRQEAVGRLSFSGRSTTLTTIAEQSPSAISPPQANSTRLDETMCPFEKFELELMRDSEIRGNQEWSDIVEDTRTSFIESDTLNATAAPFDVTIYNSDKTVDLTLVNQSQPVLGSEATPPFVLRQRIDTMSTFVQDIVKEYDELREFTTLEKQFHSEEINNIIDGLKDENSSLKVKLKTAEENRLAAEEKIGSLESELSFYKNNVSELEDKILKNSDENLLKEITELREVNSKIEVELKSKSEDFQKLREQYEEINSNFVKVSAEKVELQTEIMDLMKKVEEIKALNSDLEVTLDHKIKKSIEREAELENELKAAWKALEGRQSTVKYNELIEKECKQLEKIAIEDSSETNSTSLPNEIDSTVLADPNTTLNATLEPTEKIDFVSCDGTFNNTTYLSPAAESDPLKSFCLNESLNPVEIHPAEESAALLDSSVHENKLLIQELCEILGEKDELKQKILSMKAEASSIQKEYEEKKTSLISMTEDLKIYEDFIRNTKEALDVQDSEEGITGIEREISALKQNKVEMEENFKHEMSKLQVQLDRRNELEQVVDELIKIVNVEPSNLPDLLEKILQLVQFKTNYENSKNCFISNVITIIDEAENPELSEEDVIRRIQNLQMEHCALKKELEALNATLLSNQQNYELESAEMNSRIEALNATLLTTQQKYELDSVEMNSRIEELTAYKLVLDDVCSLLDKRKNSGETSVTVETLNKSVLQLLEQLEIDSVKVEKFSGAVADLSALLGEAYEEVDPAFDNLKSALIKVIEHSKSLENEIEINRRILDESNLKIDKITLKLEDNEKLLNEVIQSIQNCLDESYVCSLENVVECMDIINRNMNNLKNDTQELALKNEALLQLQNSLDQCDSKVEKMALELEDKACYEKLLNEVIQSIQKCLDETYVCSKENVVECVDIINRALNNLKNNSQEKNEAESHLRMEIDSLYAKLDNLQKLETFVSKLYLDLKDESNGTDSHSENIDDQLKSILDGIRIMKDLRSEIAVKSEESSSLMKYKETMEKIFHILSEGNDSVFSIDNILDEMINYKKEFIVLEEKVEKLDEYSERISEMESKLQEAFIKNQAFTEVFEKIRGDLMDSMVDNVSLESIPETIINLKRSVSSSLHASKTLEEFIEHCFSALHRDGCAPCDQSETVGDRLAVILSTIQNFSALKVELGMKYEESLCLIKYKEVLEKIFEILGDGNDSVFSVENILDEMTKYKIEFVNMEEKVEKLDECLEHISEMENSLKESRNKNNFFLGIFESVQAELKDVYDYELEPEMIPEVIKTIKNKVGEFSKFKLEVLRAIQCSSSEESVENYTIEELVSVIDDMKKDLIKLNDELESAHSENRHIREVSNKFEMKLKECMSINSIISMLGTEFGYEMQTKIQEIKNQEIECPELSKQIEKMIDFNEAYLKMATQLEESIKEKCVYESVVRSIQSLLGDHLDVNMLQEAVSALKTQVDLLTGYKNLIDDVSECLSLGNENSSIPSDKLVPSIVELKNKISIMNEKVSGLESRNIEVSETVDALASKMNDLRCVEEILSNVCSMLVVENKEQIQSGLEALKNDLREMELEKEKYLRSIMKLHDTCNFQNNTEVEDEALSCDQLIENVISRVDSLKKENLRSIELLNEVKLGLSKLCQTETCDELNLEYIRSVFNDFEKISTENSELKNENMIKRAEVEDIREKMNVHFGCVDIVFNLCQMLSESFGSTIAKGDVLDTVRDFLQKGPSNLNDNSMTSTDDSSVKEIEVACLRKEIEDLKVFLQSLGNVLGIEGDSIKEHLLQLISKLKIANEDLNSNNKSLEIDCASYRDFVTKISTSLLEKDIDDTTFDDKQLILQHILNLKDELLSLKTNNNELIIQNQLLSDLKREIVSIFQLTDPTSYNIQMSVNLLKEENGRLKATLQEMSDTNEKIISEMYEQVNKLSLTEKNEKLIELLKNLLCEDDSSEIDLIQSITQLKQNYSSLSERVQDLISENDSMRIVKGDLQSEIEKCQSILHSINVELGISNESQDELVDLVRKLKFRAVNDVENDALKSEMLSINYELRSLAENLNIELKTFIGEDFEQERKEVLLQSSEGMPLIKQLDVLLIEFVKLFKNNIELIENLKEEVNKQKETAMQVDSVKSEYAGLLDKINFELEMVDVNNEVLIERIQKLKADEAEVEELRNKNAFLKETNEELVRKIDLLKLEFNETIEKQASDVALLKSEKESLNVQILESNGTISKLEQNSIELKKELTDSISSNKSKEETIVEMEIQTKKLQEDINQHLTGLDNNAKLIDNLKSEVLAQKNEIVALKNDIKQFETNAKASDESDEIQMRLIETRKELDNVKDELGSFISADRTLRKKLVSEIKNMKSNFETASVEDSTTIDLLHVYVSVVMEISSEVVSALRSDFETESNKYREKISQLEGNEKKSKEWVNDLEMELTNSNLDVSKKSKEIDELLEVVKKKENDLKHISEDLESVTMKMKSSEEELISLRANHKELSDRIKEQLSEQNHSVSNTLKLEEELRKTTEEKNALLEELDNKKMEVSKLQSDIESQKFELKNYFNKLNDQEVKIKDQNVIIFNLKDKNEACLSEIEELKASLESEKVKCDELSCSLNTMRTQYKSLQQSLETSNKATEVIESKLEEFLKDMNATKIFTSELFESLKTEERKEQTYRKRLEKINEEKVNECNDLKTKLYLLETETNRNSIAQEEIISKLKDKVDGASKLNEELNDAILKKEEIISNKQKVIMDLKHKIDDHSKTLSFLQNSNIEKDQELLKLEKLRQEVTSLQEANNCLRVKEKTFTDLNYKNAALEKDLLERSNQITKLQDMLSNNERELHDLRAISSDVDQLKATLKSKEEVCQSLTNSVSSLEKLVADGEKTITKLKSDIICKDEDLFKMKTRLEESSKVDRHQPARLKLKDSGLISKFENMNEKENGHCLKLNTSYNSQSNYCEKCRKLEKDLNSLFKIPLNIGESVVDKVKQTVMRIDELEQKISELQDDNQQLDSECDAINVQLKSTESEFISALHKIDELKQSNVKAIEDLEKEVTGCAELRRKNENLIKDLETCRIELEKSRETEKALRRERGTERRQMNSSVSAGELPLPCTPDFKSIKHRWEQMSTSASAHKMLPTPNRECQCEELMKQNQELKLDLADKNNKINLLEIQIQGQNFPYKKKATALEEALNQAKTKIMTLKQEVRRLQTCLHDVSVYQSCETCRNKAKHTAADKSVQTAVTDSEQSVSGSEIIQRQTMNNLKEMSEKLERENMLLKRLCRDRNRKIEKLEHDLKSVDKQKS